MPFCPSCGKGIDKTRTFCEDCEPLPELKLKDIKIRICHNCDKIQRAGKWEEYHSLQRAARSVVDRVISKQLDDYSIRIKLGSLDKKPGLVVDFEAEVKKGKNTFVVPGEIHMASCDVCSKQGTGYFEGILQLRNPNEDVIKFIENYFTAQNKSMVVTGRKKQPKGTDYHLSSNKHLKELGNLLKERFGGTLKISPHIHSYDHQKSRNIYRVNVMYEPHPFVIGDIIRSGSRMIKITKLGRHVHGKDIKTGKSCAVDVKGKDVELMKRFNTSVSRVMPSLEVLHPETYQPLEIGNKADVKMGEKVRIVIDGNVGYII